MQPQPSDMADIAEVVAKAFTELKQDMDKIIAQTAVASSPTATSHSAARSPMPQQSDLPLLQLHGRTYSESPGYDDYVLSSPLVKLPEAIPETISSSTISIQAAIETEARTAGISTSISLNRRPAVGTDGSQEESAAATEAPTSAASSIQTAVGPCRRLSDGSIADEASDALVAVTAAAAGLRGQQGMQETPVATSQLSYKDLLEKALGGFDPRLKQQMQASIQKSSPEQRGTSRKQDAAAGLTANPGHSKFPGSLQQKRSSAGKSGSPASPGSLRIFKQGSGSAQKLLGRFEAEQQASVSESCGRRSTGDKPSATSRRCRSAPREQAAETNHVRRMSPGAPASATVQATARSKSNPRGSVVGTAAVSPGYIERLYALGVEKQQRRAQAPDKRSMSPVRLTEDDWRRVTTRLYGDARNKEERMRMRREKEDYARDEAMHITTGGAMSDRMHSMRRSVEASVRGLDPAFYGRQVALLERKAERARQRRASEELSSDEEKECTFHPKINATSRDMFQHRSVEDMHKWDLHRKLHMMELQEEISSHEIDELSKACTFMPKIENLSRKLALQSYAAAPDPRRPWTSSPVHMTAPVIRPYSPSRSASPNSRLAEAAGVSPSQDTGLRHSITGPHLYDANGSPVRNTGLMTTAGPAYPPPSGQPYQRLWSAPAAAAGMSRSLDANVLRRTQQQQQQQQAEQLPAGIVMGIPVGTLPAAAGGQLPEDAVVIQMPNNSSAGSQKPLLGAVAPGDGVAFISLGPIKTSVSPAAAANRDVDLRQRQVVSPVQAQMGLEQGLGSGDWAHGATAAAVRGDDSAANTPVKRTLASAIPSRLAAARAFRDDSAGGAFPAKKASAGGAWFSPVTLAQKVSPFAKAKGGAATGAGGQLQPTLSDATRAALELSQQLGLTGPAEGQALSYAAAAAARQQAVYYVAMDGRDSASKGSNSYSQKYSSSKTAKAVDSMEQMYPEFNHGDSSLVWGVADALALEKAAAMQEWQQRQQQQHASALQTAGSMQKYSTAQLLNARNRSSLGGVAPAISPSAQATAVPAGTAVTQSQEAPQLSQETFTQVLPVEASTAALPGADNGQLEQLAAQQKAEGMLIHTQSVPFELMVSPRSRLYLSTGSDGAAASPAAQQLLALLAKAEEGGLGASQMLAAAASLHHQQQTSGSGASFAASVSDQALVHGLHSPVAASPCLPDSRGTSGVPTPSGSSHNLMTQLQRSVAAAAVSSSKLSACSKANIGVSTAGSPSQKQQEAEPATTAPEATTAELAAAAGEDTVVETASRPRGVSIDGSDDGSVSGADVWELLSDAELTPQAKAQRMLKIWGKTMSKRNISLDSLQQTLEEVAKAVSASSSASGATTESSTAPAPALLQEPPPTATVVQPISADVETLEASENIQQLLLRISTENENISAYCGPEQQLGGRTKSADV